MIQLEILSRDGESTAVSMLIGTAKEQVVTITPTGSDMGGELRVDIADVGTLDVSIGRSVRITHAPGHHFSTQLD